MACGIAAHTILELGAPRFEHHYIIGDLGRELVRFGDSTGVHQLIGLLSSKQLRQLRLHPLQKGLGLLLLLGLQADQYRVCSAGSHLGRPIRPLPGRSPLAPRTPSLQPMARADRVSALGGQSAR